MLYLSPPSSIHASSFPHPYFVLIHELQHSLNKGCIPAATGDLSYLKPLPPFFYGCPITLFFPSLFEIITVTREPSFIVLLNLQDKILLNKGFIHKYQRFRLHIRNFILFIPLILFWLIMYDYFATWWVISLSLISVTDLEQSNETY